MVITPLLVEASNNQYSTMTDEFLRKNYVPKVYQKSIYSIDYDKLKLNGVKLISFDIDETIAGDNEKDPPKTAVTLIENLKTKGFDVVLITNANHKRGSHFGSELNVKYITDAKKPLTNSFKKILKDYGLKPRQMAHVGNNQFDDVAGGNSIGIITCLVHNVSGSGCSDNERELKNELRKRGIWSQSTALYQLR